MQIIETENHNNKLNANCFVIISEQPTKPIAESSLPIQVSIKEKVKTRISALDIISNPAMQKIAYLQFNANMITLLKFPINRLPSVFTYLGYGLDQETFKQKHYPKVPADHPVAVYIFQKTQ